MFLDLGSRANPCAHPNLISGRWIWRTLFDPRNQWAASRHPGSARYENRWIAESGPTSMNVFTATTVPAAVCWWSASGLPDLEPSGMIRQCEGHPPEDPARVPGSRMIAATDTAGGGAPGTDRDSCLRPGRVEHTPHARRRTLGPPRISGPGTVGRPVLLIRVRVLPGSGCWSRVDDTAGRGRVLSPREPGRVTLIRSLGEWGEMIQSKSSGPIRGDACGDRRASSSCGTVSRRGHRGERNRVRQGIPPW